jgi:hypothetical protein
MKNTLTLGYTLTDCYSANANYKGKQKQLVIKTTDAPNRGEEMKRVEGLVSVFVKGFVNAPSDMGRFQEFNPIAEITEEEYKSLQAISNEHKYINWNTGKYSIWTSHLPKKKYAAIKQAESAYLKLLSDTCEPFNRNENKKAVRKIKAILKNYLSKKEYKNCENFIYQF